MAVKWSTEPGYLVRRMLGSLGASSTLQDPLTSYWVGSGSDGVTLELVLTADRDLRGGSRGLTGHANLSGGPVSRGGVDLEVRGSGTGAWFDLVLQAPGLRGATFSGLLSLDQATLRGILDGASFGRISLSLNRA